jgi:PAS domain-containing protein
MKITDNKVNEETSLGAIDSQETYQERYRGLFQHMRAGVAVYEAVDDGNDFIFRDFNISAERISRVRREDLIGKRLLEVFPNMDDFGLLGSLRRVYKTGLSEHLPAKFYQDASRERGGEIITFTSCPMAKLLPFMKM